jgi:hypothetical protein
MEARVVNAAKSKQTGSPTARLVSTFLPFLQSPWRRAFVGVILAGGLLGGVYFGWQRWGGQILHQPEYLLKTENIEIPPQPPWIRSDVKADAIRDGGLTGLSILDRRLTVNVARAFSMHTWVEEVTRVSKYHPARVVVELVYRRPAAMVEVVINGQPGLLPIDANGILLPPGDFTAEQARDYLRISLPAAAPAGTVGTPWGDPRIHGAARVAAVFQEHWKKLGLYRILAESSTPMPPTQQDPNFVLVTRQGARVVWGTAPQAGSPAELKNALGKVSYLLQYVESHGPLDTLSKSTEIDLSASERMGPRTAERLTAPNERTSEHGSQLQ